MSSQTKKNLELYHNLECVTVVMPGVKKNKGSGSSKITKRFPKGNKCGMCREIGHNSRSCGMKKNKGKQIKFDDNKAEE